MIGKTLQRIVLAALILCAGFLVDNAAHAADPLPKKSSSDVGALMYTLDSNIIHRVPEWRRKDRRTAFPVENAKEESFSFRHH